jgi:hypothetical protein
MPDPLLRKLESLSSLSADEKRVLSEVALSRTRTYGAAEDIVLEEHHPKDCNVVLDGVVCSAVHA